MAASSPSPNSNKSIDPVISAASINGNTTPQRLAFTDTPRQNQRGLNKPKCIKCGNVARSRCPFQSCKNCCAKAQNPCHIHVLKQSSILPDKAPPSAAPLSEQPSTPEVPSSKAATWRLNSIRQLSANFANTLRTKKPLTRKDAVNINKWRFSKLKEHIEGDIEAEDEAFDRYMWNVSLLEETFSTEGLHSDDQPEPASSEERFQKLVAAMKVKLRSNSEKVDSCRKRVRSLVDQQLQKLRESSLPCADQADASKDLKKPRKEGDLRADRNVAFADLIDKLSKARSTEDFKSCLEMKLQILNQSETESQVANLLDELDGVANMSDDPDAEVDGVELPALKHQAENTPKLSYSLPKPCNAIEISEDVSSKIYAELSASGNFALL